MKTKNRKTVEQPGVHGGSQVALYQWWVGFVEKAAIEKIEE